MVKPSASRDRSARKVIHRSQSVPPITATVCSMSSPSAASVVTSLTSGAPDSSKTRVLVVYGEPTGLRTEAYTLPVSGSVRRGAATE